MEHADKYRKKEKRSTGRKGLKNTIVKTMLKKGNS